MYFNNKIKEYININTNIRIKMIKKRGHNIFLGFLLINIILISGCATQSKNLITPAEFTNAQTNKQTDNIIKIEPAGFNPKTLTIKTGNIVTFVNKDSRMHWPASAIHPIHAFYDETSLDEHCPNPDNATFDACKGLEHGKNFSFKFDKTGSWKYHDHLNPSNTGTIVVE